MNEVFCTQEKIRDIDKLIHFTKKYLNNENITFPYLLRMNGKLYVYDGHTRFIGYILSYKYTIDTSFLKDKDNDFKNSIINTAIINYCSRCKILDVEDWYTKLPEVSCGFVTPFDLHEEVRVSDFYSVKKYIIKHIEDTGDISIIDKTSHLYKKKRTIKTMQELASLYDFIVERLMNEQNNDLAVLP